MKFLIIKSGILKFYLLLNLSFVPDDRPESRQRTRRTSSNQTEGSVTTPEVVDLTNVREEDRVQEMDSESNIGGD